MKKGSIDIVDKRAGASSGGAGSGGANSNTIVEKTSLNESNEFGDDMESLLKDKKIISKNQSKSHPGKFELDIDGNDTDGNNENNSNRNHIINSNLTVLISNRLISHNTIWFGLVPTQHRGNMKILFPRYFVSDGFGVLGPHYFGGPVCVWLILVGATYGCVKGANKHGLGIPSIVICYVFLFLCTYRLVSVSFRDPGICLAIEIPGHETQERANQYRFCERCDVWQPPDGVHCPETNICIEGYDHYCVWMGTCIGKRNYREFVLFNITWLYYAVYAVFWVLIIGPIMMKLHENKQ